MSIFKLLSRSAKPAQASPAQTLPSSGAAANPQLFGHDERNGSHKDTTTSKKRKRGLDNEDSASALPADIDFFGGASRRTEETREDDAKTRRTEHARHSTDDPVSLGREDGGADTVEAYDEEESKRILRSHKLKIVVLEDFKAKEEEAPTEKKKKSKKRKSKNDVADKKKNAKQQLYPQPLASFAELRTRYGISRRLAENLREQGYKVPTEVQLGALPLLLGKRTGDSNSSTVTDPSGAGLAGDVDLLTVAPTGSGKTIAFLVPIINALLSEAKTSNRSAGPRAVVIAPTRELASQIVNEARKLAKGTGIKAALMKKGMEVVERAEDNVSEEANDSPEPSDEEHGSASDDSDTGAQMVQQPKRRKRRAELVKADILVATPLALLNALKLQDDKFADLPSIRHLVLDEADVLLDPLFREQTLALWNVCTNPKLRVGLWSATMGSNIEALTTSTLTARWTSLSPPPNVPRPPLIRLVVGLKDTAIPNISHQLTYAATEQGKLLGLRQLLHPTMSSSTSTTPSLRPPFLVFTQTIPRAIALHSELLYDIPPQAGGSTRLAVLHADLGAAARDAIMTRFRRGEIWVLITTDLLARGVDFRGLNGVVNYDVPNSAAGYVHRVGRTGRAGRDGGVAVTFYTQDDIPYVKNIANVIRASEKLRGVGEDEGSVKQWLLDALPTPSKRDKQMLKTRGVEARRRVKDGEGRGKGRISTKSGYERRLEGRKRGAMIASRGLAEGNVERKAIAAVSESEFEGFDE
ncbi:P-loop containing nucleoside triphosphate hydrolase protein [Massariosphaeria phaeospora]|uniref:ATP-dependent RNA helicase ROK1 n=1 Tax=Massariosphaeria phaeospora TaxID=100035 RepID=A0A7C8M8B6_9PLEO|nr:P-loop containing nucleoside triphosphate hydrolase protein [Massariosphaeria phaeospora]